MIAAGLNFRIRRKKKICDLHENLTAKNFYLINAETMLNPGLPRWRTGKESTCQGRRHGFDPWVGKIPWGRAWQLPPVFLPGKSQGQRSLVGCHLWGHTELDMTEAT